MKIYTIKETAKITGLPESTLRYYEKMGLIKDIKRDEVSKYRVYNEMNLALISAIACLNATGMSIDDMKKYVGGIYEKNVGNQKQIETLQHQKQIIIKEEKELKLRKKYIDGKIKYWKMFNENDKEGIKELRKELDKLSAKLRKIEKNIKKV